MQIFLIVLALHITAIAIYQFSQATVAVWRSMRLSTIGIFFGPTLAKIRIGRVVLRLNVLPLGGYCRFSTTRSDVTDPGNEDELPDDPRRPFDEVPTLERIAVVLVGPLSLVAVAVILLGPADALHTTVRAMVVSIHGALAPNAVAAPKLAEYGESLAQGQVADAAGTWFAVFAGVNLLPYIGVAAGGFVLTELWHLITRDRISERWLTRAALGFLFIALLQVGSWTIALWTAIRL